MRGVQVMDAMMVAVKMVRDNIYFDGRLLGTGRALLVDEGLR
ncbi:MULTISPECIES: hypothetical protein [unclassified Nocardia]